jgi:hypothetical protein
MKLPYILFLSLFALKLVHSEVYLNPFHESYLNEIDKDEKVIWSISEVNQDGEEESYKRKFFKDESLNYYTYGANDFLLSEDLTNSEYLKDEETSHWYGPNAKLKWGTLTFGPVWKDYNFKVYDSSKKTQYIEVGHKWKTASISFYEYFLDYNTSKWVSVMEEHNSSHYVSGTKKITTPWGVLNALELISYTDTLYTLRNSNASYMTDYRLLVSKNNKNVSYYINGLGLYSSYLEINKPEPRGVFPDKWSAREADTYSMNPDDIWVEEEIQKKFIDRFKKSISVEFASSTMKHNVKDFIALTVQDQNSPQLNSWTWNGAFPWVYNHATESWFYYAFSGDSYDAYDARSGSWFTFDSGTGAWNPSN